MQDAQVTHVLSGPLYVAFVQPDIMIIATDLPFMARALDVLDGKQPSLATQDPLGLKLRATPGAMVEAAGIDPNPVPAGGAIKSASMTRFTFSVDGKQLRIEASLTMPDSDSADQVKDTIVGLKFVGGASQPDAKALLDPITVAAPADIPGRRDNGKM